MTGPRGTNRDDGHREAIVAGCRELERRGLTQGTSGNISLRLD